MFELRRGSILALLGVLFILNLVRKTSTGASPFESDDNTTCTEKCNCKVLWIFVVIESGIIIVAIIGGAIYLTIYRHRRTSMHSVTYDLNTGHIPSRLTEDSLTEGPISSDTPTIPTQDNSTEGRISNVELWTLVVYSARNKENDKLSEAITKLPQGTHGIPTPKDGKCSTDYARKLQDFQSLCSWKKTCAGTEQMEKLFEACSQADMAETVKELKDFRNDVSEGVSKYDLKHILWQIGKKSSKNITTLLDRLPRSPFNQESSVPKYVDRAFHELQIWTMGNHAINPAVMLSLQSDDLCDEDMYFCTVSEEKKRPLKDTEIKQHIRDVSKAHCQKILSIISTKFKSKHNKEEKVFSTIINENETDLFNTYQMIEEWLDEQECSNYEKRIRLRNAVEGAPKACTSNEICLDEIYQLASSKGNAEAAYELLMKDIKPFAAKLPVDESKLTKYRQPSSSFQSTQGTIGLVADVMQKKEKK